MEPTRINNWETQKDDLQDYADKWEKALKDGIFKDSKVENPIKEDPFFDMIKKEPTDQFKPADVDYWNKIQDMSSDTNGFTVLNESKKKNTKKKESIADFKSVDNSLKSNKDVNNIVKKAKKLGNNPNPVHHDSYGKDTEDESGKTKVTAGLSADDRIPSLQELYKALYKLEVKMSSKDGLNKKSIDGMQRSIRKVKNLITKISDSMGGDFKSASDYN
jgi:cell fate (sporulation/competence/biofilm development) regulator YmcA (YheA/YmcA/DUF963 family)